VLDLKDHFSRGDFVKYILENRKSLSLLGSPGQLLNFTQVVPVFT